jgi:hypothetical protein
MMSKQALSIPFGIEKTAVSGYPAIFSSGFPNLDRLFIASTRR